MFNNNNTNAGGGGGLFNNAGANNQQGQQQQTGGLFANNTNNQNNQQGGGGGLFNNQNNTTNNNAGGGGLFANNNNNTTQNAGGGGLFGNNNTTTQNAGGGLFGNNNTTQNTGGGLFGNNNTTQNTGGGLFGNTNAAANTQQGLFGASQNQQNQITGFLNQYVNELNQEQQTASNLSRSGKEVYEKLQRLENLALFLEKKKYILAYEQLDQKKRLDKMQKQQDLDINKNLSASEDINKQIQTVKDNNVAILNMLVNIQCKLDMVASKKHQVIKKSQEDFELQKQIKNFQARLSECRHNADLLKPNVQNYVSTYERRQQQKAVLEPSIDEATLQGAYKKSAEALFQLNIGLQELKEYQEGDRLELDKIIQYLEEKNKYRKNY